ncbi:MAG: SprB repeat-containing protein, partial [Bacteroidota bacterium]|nr:SprB repeat-containing protein [Bacteroidota bacterium]
MDLAIVDATCSGGCDGSATVTPSGGIDPYTFNWTPVPPTGQGTASAEGLCAGIWQVQIEDALGCDTLISINIGSPPPFQIDLLVEAESCAGPCTGSATVSISGGTGSPTIFWQPDPINGQGTSSVTGLCSGIGYSVQIVDVNGCDTTIFFSIDPFDAILSNLSATAVTCAASCDGTVSASPTGGVPPYAFIWSPAPLSGQGTALATGFCAGEVIVQISDAAGCVISDTVSVIGPEPLTDNAIVTDATCHNQCNGSIIVAPSGGVGPYQVFWSPVPVEGQGSLVSTGLCLGTYLVQIIDANGCDQIFSHEIFKPNEIELDLVTSPSECQQCIGSASVSITGGVPGYSIEWIDPLGNVISATDSAQNMCAGLYVIEVTDANGCVVTQGVPITDPNGEQLTAVNGITTCPASCDGTAAVNFICSDPSCVIAWSDLQGQPLAGTDVSIDQLCEGSYFVTVTNASGCVSIEQVDVLAPSSLVTTVSTTSISCPFECDGTASIGLAGGVPPFTITWDPAPGIGQGSTIVSGLCAGTYMVEILDGSGCITSFPVVLDPPAHLQVSAAITDISCASDCDGSIMPTISGGVAPYLFSWSPQLTSAIDGSVTDLCAGTYQLMVTDANGCSITEVYTINEAPELELIGTSTASTCPDCDGTASILINGGVGPFDVEWVYQNAVIGTTTSLSSLCGGLYMVTVTDANGCSDMINVVVPDNNAEILSPVNGQTNCANDCNGSVGVDLNCSLPPCTAVWTNSTGDVIAQDVFQVAGLCVGQYFVQVTNGSGCTSVTSAWVNALQQFIIDMVATPISCSGSCDATVSVTPTGGVAPYTFNWSPEPSTGQGTGNVSGLCAGSYIVNISDASGCDTML